MDVDIVLESQKRGICIILESEKKLLEESELDVEQGIACVKA